MYTSTRHTTHTRIYTSKHTNIQELYTYFEEYVEMSGEDAGTGKNSKLKLNNIK